jgi:hypothetical protein
MGVVILIAIVGCGTTREAAKISQPEIAQTNGKIPFLTEHVQALAAAKIGQDSSKKINFWLSNSIKITGLKSLRIQDGEVIQKQADQISISDVGHITSFGSKSLTLCVGFEIDDAVYQIWFKATLNGEYVLDQTTKGSVFYDGKYYPIEISADTEIKLLFSLRDE